MNHHIWYAYGYHIKHVRTRACLARVKLSVRARHSDCQQRQSVKLCQPSATIFVASQWLSLYSTLLSIISYRSSSRDPMDPRASVFFFPRVQSSPRALRLELKEWVFKLSVSQSVYQVCCILIDITSYCSFFNYIYAVHFIYFQYCPDWFSVTIYSTMLFIYFIAFPILWYHTIVWYHSI